MTRFSPRFLVLLALSWSLTACGDQAPAGEEKDDSPVRDASVDEANPEDEEDEVGARSEAEPDQDGRPKDASVRADAGPRATDAGTPSPTPDASLVKSDASTAPDDVDAGASSDAGATKDAGSAPADAGPREGPGAITPPTKNMTVTSTIIVKAGTNFDGKGTRFIAGPSLGSGDQDEGQKPVFQLEDGATLSNVTLGSPAADGIHTYGDVTLENIVWEDIGEDAMTIKESGTVVLRGGSAVNGDDKVFQINAASTFRVSQFRAKNAGKFIRQNGGTTFEVKVFIEGCDISQMKEAIFRTDSSSSSVSMIDTRYSDIGKELFIGLSAGKITQKNNTMY